MSALTTIPWLADKLLNTVVQHTILLQGYNELYDKISASVQLGWELVRDLINIAIIGTFVFIAIGIILGLKEYGQKRLIAKVLIVAVLINFSFLFTRIAINFSNAIATSLYSKTILSSSGNGLGIGSNFLHQLRIETASGDGNVWNGLANTSNSSDNNSKYGSLLVHIFVSAMVALVSGIILLYIAFLLIARFVVLILLLITSSAAFGAYLLPSTTHFWNKWWTLLFKNSLVAPILFVFLWIALNISESVSGILCPVGANCTAGGITTSLQNPAPGINFLLNYIIVLGFMFTGIYIANSFSTSLSRRVAMLGITPAIAYPLRGVGLVGRNTIGKGAQKVSDNFKERAKAANLRNPGGFGMKAWDKLAQGVKSVTKRDFNPGNLTSMRAAQTKLGGFEGQEKRRRDEISQRQKRTTYSNDELKQASATAIKKAREENATGDVLEAKKREATAANEAAKSFEQVAKNAQDTKEKLGKEIDALHDKLAATPGSTTAAEEITKQINEKKSAMTAQDEAIKNAKQDALTKTNEALTASGDAERLQKALERRAQDFMPKGQEYMPEGQKPRPFNERVEDNAVADAYKRFSNILGRAAGQTMEGDKWAQSLRKSTKDYLHHEEQSKAIKELAKQVFKIGGKVDSAKDKAHDDASSQKDVLKEIKDNHGGESH